MTEELKQLREAEAAAWSEMNTLEDAVKDEIRAAESRINRWHADGLQRLRGVHAAAKKARRDYENAQAIAEAQERLPYPVGTVVCEWEQCPRYSRTETKTHQLTGRKGVIEIVTAQSVFAENVTWSKPSVGEVIVRLLNSKGSPSKKFAGFNHWSWRPQGVDYNEELHAKELAAKREAEEAAWAERERKLAAAVEVFGL